MARAQQHRKQKAAPQSEQIDNTAPTKLDQPVFGQPLPTPDPTKFVIHHPSDNPVYKQIDELNREHKLAAIPFPAPRGGVEPKTSACRRCSAAAATPPCERLPNPARSFSIL